MAAVRDNAVPGAGLKVALLASLAALLVSAFAVIYSSHGCRQLYQELQRLDDDHWFLQEEYSRLLLEESAWASYSRVEKVATGELGMHPPTLQQLKVVAP
ncbi:MAG: cell division protein FtsL [Parahaliea sp.]